MDLTKLLAAKAAALPSSINTSAPPISANTIAQLKGAPKPVVQNMATPIPVNNKLDALLKATTLASKTSAPAVQPAPVKQEVQVTSNAVSTEKKPSLSEILLAKSKATTKPVEEVKETAEDIERDVTLATEPAAPAKPTGLTVPSIPDTKNASASVANTKASLGDLLRSKLSAMPMEEAKTVVDALTPVQKKTLAEILAEKSAPKTGELGVSLTAPVAPTTEPPKEVKKESFATDIVLNKEQASVIEMALSGKSFVVTGAAGTGKTTTERGLCRALIEQKRIGTTTFKVKGSSDRVSAPAIAIVGFTNRAATNSAKAILKDELLAVELRNNIMTVHSLLEFEPEEYYDDVEGKMKFRFAPRKTASNKLELDVLIIEEATLIGLDLWKQLYDALPYGVQIIYVGDINQLQPVFGASIMNYASALLPTVELTQVYRQAEGSPIIDNAHNILRGESLVPATNSQGKLSLITGKNNIAVGQLKTSRAMRNMFRALYADGSYNPEEDMILTPYNVQELGVINMNNHIAQMLSEKFDLVVHEVIAGFNKLYLAEGDKVIVEKKDAIITKIEANPAYVGRVPQPPSNLLTRFGTLRSGKDSVDLEAIESGDVLEGDIDYSNMDLDEEADKRERKQQASHIITVTYESGFTERLSAVGCFTKEVFQLGYAMTCHKAQGSEWNKVFILMHSDHVRSLNREWLYTAVTRARTEVYIFAKEYIVDKVIAIQRCRGNTLAEKLEYFNASLTNLQDIPVTKE